MNQPRKSLNNISSKFTKRKNSYCIERIIVLRKKLTNALRILVKEIFLEIFYGKRKKN